MASPRKLCFLAISIYLALLSAQQAVAACDTHQPGTGETVQCDANAPNPDTVAVVSAAGATNVTVNIAQGSQLSVNAAPALSAGDGSQITNAGEISGTTGVLLREGSSILNNSGSIIGSSGAGIQFSGSGNNQLTNSGTIATSTGSNAVVFGSGADRLTLTGGTISGNVDTGDGADIVNISNGAINGTLSQGAGIDDFVMSGGSLNALQQGDNRDTFTMTGGTIVGAFEDGDVATMTGGTIGRVNMKLDNNIFDMSGGQITGNLVTGFGNDTILISGNSVIGGNISLSGGTDSVTVTGGTVKGNILMSLGNDLLVWQGGTLLGNVLMEFGSDRIELTNLNATSAATSPLLDGGAGDDTLVMNNSVYTHNDAHILQGIEHIELTNGSTLTLSNRLLPLGDDLDDNASTGFVLDGSSTLAIQNASATAFNSHLSGNGTVSTDTAGNAFTFTSNNASDNFAGTLALGNSTFDLSGLNTQALNQATLRTNTGSTTTVGSGVQTLGGLVFSGGTVDFGSVAPGDTLADNSIQTRGALDISGSGTVRVGVNPVVNTYPVAATRLPLLAQDDANTLIKLAGADGRVIGTGGGLLLTDASGNVITDSLTDDILQNGSVVAQGTWDWRLSSGENQDGLYIAYALRQLDLQATGSNALQLNSNGASGNAADLSAKITGNGDIAFNSAAGQTVSLSGADNDYLGVTRLLSGNVLMNNNQVLGNTSLLEMSDNTALAMNGFSQQVGRVATAENSRIDLGGGSLTIDLGGTVNGNLLGAGTLILNNSTLDINSENALLTANTQLRSGSTINLSHTNGLGSGTIDNAGLLNINAASGTLLNPLSNNGDVDLHASQVTLAADNSAFTGAFTIDPDSLLSVSAPNQLGSAVINDAGTLALTPTSDWTLANSVTGEGNLVKAGTGVVTLTSTSGRYTGQTDIMQGGINFGSRSQPVTLATSQVNIYQGFLAGNGTLSGSVNNQGLLRVGNTADATPGNDTLTINGDLLNSGNIQVGQAGGATQAGNRLNINGDYSGNNGRIAFTTALGDDSSQTDHLAITGDTSGITRVSVANAGGYGARTLNGIELISVAGNSEGTFLQDGRIVAGAYDYRLAKGAGSGQRNWYLTNDTKTPLGLAASDPGSAPQPTPSYDDVMLRPEAASYTANLAAANTMFTTRLHDRLGETQYTDVLTGEKRVTSLWLRQVGTHNSWRSDIGSLKTTSNQYVAMLGGDVAQWSQDGRDRAHLGVMAGYGNNQSHSQSSITGYRANGQVEGYSVGLYGTWYANDDAKTGLWLDSWALYNWFKNRVNGNGLPEEKYDSQGVSASLESGYTWKMGEFSGSQQSLYGVYLQPQAQLIWMGVSADDHTEHNGTRVSSDGDNNLQSRLGVRFFMQGHSAIDNNKTREFQPFVEMNWLHNTETFRTTLNGVEISQNGARNIGEIKTGVEGQLSRNLTAWGNIGQQIGDQGYASTEAMLGVKYSW